MLFIIGMVKVPVPITLATALPEMVPKKALETVSALAGPPRVPPNIAVARSIRNFPPPHASRKEPNKMKRKT
jgi:hypothetical protein